MNKYYCSSGPSGVKYTREDGSVVIDIKFSEMEVMILEKVNLVKAYRTGAGLTQEQMAKAIDVHVNTYRALEENPTKFSVEQAKKFVEEINRFDPSVKASDIFSL